MSGKVYVDRDEFMRQMIKCLGSEEWKKALEWGMAFYAAVHTPYITMQDHKDTYPCNYCGNCPILLATFEPDIDLDTLEKVIIECVRRDCNLVGGKVENAEV